MSGRSKSDFDSNSGATSVIDAALRRVFSDLRSFAFYKKVTKRLHDGSRLA